MSRRRQILDAAVVAFHEKGFHGVGVDELGERAQLSGPSLYRHFSGKDEILATALDEAMDDLLGAAARVHDDPDGDLRRALRHHIGFALRNRELVTLYQREADALAEPWATSFAARRRTYTRAWEELVARRFPDLDAAVVRVATQTCLGAVFSLATWPRGTRATPGVEELLLDQVWHGLGGYDTAGPESGSAS